jgi:adenylyltransferase/sulfurtransferase
MTFMKDDELLRYSRHILLPEVDISGQEKLLASSALIVGMGGLGCPVAMYLAASGVGHLGLADFDRVDLSNLQRQIAHGTQSIGKLKVESARETIAELNPDTRITCIEDKLSGKVLEENVAAFDIVLDCSDNFLTRFAVNTACVTTGTPLVSGAAIQLEGQVMVMNPADPNSPCYQCLYDEADDSQFSCSENGVLAPVTGIIGAIQATEALKLIAGFGDLLSGYLLLLDAKTMQWQKFKLPRNPHCAICGDSSNSAH